MTRIPSLPITAAAVALACAAVAPLAAQQPAADTTAPRQAADTATLRPVVVTATRMNASTVAPLVSTTVITGAALRAQGITSLGQALAAVPGAFAPRSGSPGAQTSLFLRGGQSDYTQVLVDGVPVNDPGGFIDLANLTTDDVERIEIVRGPASVLYGANAVTGVVQIFTRAGTGRPHGSVSVRGGTFGSQDETATLLAGNTHTALTLGVGRHRTNGAYAFNDQSRNDTYSALVRVSPDDRTLLRLSARYIDAGAHIPTNYYGAVVDSNQFHLERRWIGSLEAERALGDRVHANLTLSATNGSVRSADLPDSAGADCPFCYDSRAGTYRRTADLRLSYRAGPSLALTAGGTVERQSQHTTGGPVYARDLHAVYAEAVGTLHDAVSLTLGARLDDNSQFGRFGTWRAAAGWLLAHGTTLRASVGTAFKEPTFDQTSSTSPYARGNPALRPERARSWDAGVEQTLAGGRATVSATYFQQRFRDMIQYDPAPPTDSAPNYVNLAAANADGVELRAAVAPWRTWTIAASWTRLLTRVTDAGIDAGPAATFVQGARLLRRPSSLATLAIGFQPAAPLRLQAQLHYVGSRVDIDFLNYVRVTAPAYTVTDLSADYTLPLRLPPFASPTLTARLANALDARYAPIYGFRAPGRAILLGLASEW